MLEKLGFADITRLLDAVMILRVTRSEV